MSSREPEGQPAWRLGQDEGGTEGWDGSARPEPHPCHYVLCDLAELQNLSEPQLLTYNVGVMTGPTLREFWADKQRCAYVAGSDHLINVGCWILITV